MVDEPKSGAVATEEPKVAATETPVKDKNVVDAVETQDEDTLLGKEEAAAAKSNVPEKYDFKVPEGMQLDNAAVEKFTPVFKDVGLTQEQAQKLVDAYSPYVKEQVAAQQKESIDYFKKTVDGWKQETQKELGADPQKQLAVAAKAINKFGSPALRELLNETGVGNNKEFVNFFIKVGKTISEDHFTEPNKQSTGDSKEAYLERNYPSMKGT